jgi:long-chain acyl-CoA synthetase
MLSHANFIQNCVACRSALKMGETDRHLSFLPLSHVFERTAGYYLMLFIGAEIAYAEDLDSVPKNILETRPTFLLGVPRFYEKVRARVLERVNAASSFRKGMFHWALDLGRKKRTGTLGPLDRIEHALAGALVYRKFRAGLGGKLRFGVSGGAPLSRELAEFFCDLGIVILEGYGLSETAPVICCNREEKYRFGSVGLVVDGVQVRIAEDGEIQTKSPCVMSGYWQKPQETAEVLKDGWFSTGDLGRFDEDGFLSITGRKKELIVTSGGKKISPRPIEELLERDPSIVRCVLYGDRMKFLTALVVPNREALLNFARSSKIAFADFSDLLTNRRVIEWYDSRIQEAMKDFASYEKIKAFALLENDFTQAAGELTPTLKVKRSVVHSRYASRLSALYPPEPGTV